MSKPLVIGLFTGQLAMTGPVASADQKLPEIVVADLPISYTRKKVLNLAQLKLPLELTNLTDERYVGVINSFDDSRAGSTSYYQGSPFSAIGTVSVTF